MTANHRTHENHSEARSLKNGAPLPVGLCALVISGLSLLCWAVVILFVLVIRATI